jgi:hypothetical protein
MAGVKAPNNITPFVNAVANQAPNGATASPTSYASGRVKDVILDDTHPLFEEFGGWNGIGTILYEDITIPGNTAAAKPYFGNIKYIPVLEEIVWLVALPSTEMGGNALRNGISTLTNQYYICPVSLWNHPHHNAYPTFPDRLPESQQKDYQQTQAGSVRRVTDQSTEIELGSTFLERAGVHPLQPYQGDLIYEGRWGNSIRFGSTVNNSSIKNTWSKSGENGDPITIIRNGQHEDGKDPWVPQVEDINKDKSSIYLTSTQNIPIEPSSFKTKSYDNAPTNPSRFAGEQIILNSGRLFFNSKTDSILFSSADTINLNAVNSVNIDAPKTVIQSDEVLLGDKNAKESVILGDKFLSDLQKLLISLTTLTQALSTPIGTPIPFVPNMVIPAPAIDAKIKAQNMLNKIERYKSKVSKTK